MSQSEMVWTAFSNTTIIFKLIGAINSNKLKYKNYIIEVFNNTVDDSLWENSKL